MKPLYLQASTTKEIFVQTEMNRKQVGLISTKLEPKTTGTNYTASDNPALADNREVVSELRKVIDIFKASEGEIRPHFVLTGPSGSGKSYTVESLVNDADLGYIEINAAQLTKEGTAGNSLSKALSPLMNMGGRPCVCFVDEFDKLFISGNSNSQLAHETTNGVQNEFLKVLEGKSTSVYGDFGKYIEVPVSNVLFIFAGAFNGEEEIDVDRLRHFGIKTEFIGRVGLIYNMQKVGIETMQVILESSPLLERYLGLFPRAVKEESVDVIMQRVKEAFEQNTLGVRLINTLIHQYFINGGKLAAKEAKKISFQKTLDWSK